MQSVEGLDQAASEERLPRDHNEIKQPSLLLQFLLAAGLVDLVLLRSCVSSPKAPPLRHSQQ